MQSIILALILLFLGCLNALAHARLELSARKLEFGNIHYKGDGATFCPLKDKRVTLHNHGGDTLRIIKILTSDDASKPDLKSSVIAPKDSTELRVTCFHLAFMPMGDFSREILIHTNDSLRPKDTLKCTGFLTSLDFSFDLGDTTLTPIETHNSSQACVKSFYLDNRSDSALTIDSISHARGCHIIPSSFTSPPRSRTKFQALLKPGTQKNRIWKNRIFFKGMSFESVHIRLGEQKAGKPMDCEKKKTKRS